MNRRILIYFSIGLTMVSLVFGSLKFAAAETSIVPAGLTETFTPVPSTETPMPTETPALTNTPTPTETPALTDTPTPTETPGLADTPTPAATSTSAPAATNTPAPTYTPTTPAVVGLPDTGGGAPTGVSALWMLALVAAAGGGLGVLAIARRRHALYPIRR